MFFKKLLKTELRAQYYELDLSPYIKLLNSHPVPQGPASSSLQSYYIPCLPLLLSLTHQSSSVLLPNTTRMHPLLSMPIATVLV